MKKSNLAGLRAGKLVAVERVGSNDKGRAIWVCECDCGNRVNRLASIMQDAAKRGKASHCGCSPPLKTHGLSRTHKKIYQVWGAMVQRCENPANKDYPNYGGRGIKLCPEWRNNFVSFFCWAKSTGYREGLTIERHDVNGGYNSSNCGWTENKRQSLNCRKSIILSHNGKTQHLSDWAREYGICYKTLRGRLFSYGWEMEKALTLPPRKGRNQHA